MEAVLRDIGFLLKESFTLTEINYNNHSKQLEEFKKLDFENQGMIDKLTQEATRQEQAYFNNIYHFKKSRELFREKLEGLLIALDPSAFDAAVREYKVHIDRSLTTHGMRQGIKKIFDEFRWLLNECNSRSDELKQYVIDIHAQFDTEHGLKEIKPTLFEINDYVEQLEELINIGEEFRTSARTIMTEKTLVTRKLFSTMINQARKVTYKTFMDATTWGENVLSPIAHQLIDQKKQIENRLIMLRSTGDSKAKVLENMKRLEAELNQLKQQRIELNLIIQNIQKATSGK